MTNNQTDQQTEPEDDKTNGAHFAIALAIEGLAEAVTAAARENQRGQERLVRAIDRLSGAGAVFDQ